MFKIHSALSIVWFVLNHIPPSLWKLMDFVLDILLFWFQNLVALLQKKNPKSEAKKALSVAESFEEWEQIAYYIDNLNGVDLWRHNPISKDYDYRLINERLNSLRAAKESNDVWKIISLFKSGLLRNFGGISDKELFVKSYIGTKILIEEYIQEVLNCLYFINDFNVTNAYSSLKPNQMKLDLFHDARQTFGSTALILQGGSLFGLCHLGVIKALYFKGLLPRIISGSAVGAVIASFVCTLSEKELECNLLNIVKFISKEIDVSNYKASVDEMDTKYGNMIENVFQKGYTQDILIFIKYVRFKLGDLTFEEAYLKTDRILNILVHPTDSSVPSLLNYVTAPNMIIWSALQCSIGTGVLSDDVRPYIKDLNNEIKPLKLHSCKFLSPHQISQPNLSNYTVSAESPYQRLTELFNVNHFIVSLARPYFAPLIGNDLKHSNSWYPKIMIKRILALELQHRVYLLDKFGLLFKFIKRMAIDEKTPRTKSSEITIVPEFKTLVKDFGKIFDVNKYDENIPYWILVGERSAWPLIPILWTRTSIEFALDDLYNLNRKRK
ncbi:hypothetical protein PACTADRAFT_47709 [Pachysolen tannophilus NRRL Y-2460]|uniref:PNPLA domain-containing protein n=1 Tax=Pachysolen tannophilus NRRL Y-2460 TaxID=669874 RepID=A0A1E4U1J7_PACTA|nr:hypothetical protein PACTADRAFT_47709 [Pachysolen tannophilus NRRL Y-2460]